MVSAKIQCQRPARFWPGPRPASASGHPGRIQCNSSSRFYKSRKESGPKAFGYANLLLLGGWGRPKSAFLNAKKTIFTEKQEV